MNRLVAAVALNIIWTGAAFAQTPDFWTVSAWSQGIAQPSAPGPLAAVTFPKASVPCGLAPNGAGVPVITAPTPTSSLRFKDPSDASKECAIVLGPTLVPTPAGSYTYTLDAIYRSAALPFTVSPPPPLQTIFVKDSFTGASGTAITSHVGETGAVWKSQVPNNGNSPGSVVLDGAGGLRGNSLARESLYFASGIPPTAEYDLEADFVAKSIIPGQYVGLMGRIASTTATFYDIVTDGSTWYLQQFVNGTGTGLGTCGAPLAAGQTAHVKLSLRNAAISATVNGTACASSPSPIIAGAGQVGVAFYQTGVQSTTTTGIHVDNVVAHTP